MNLDAVVSVALALKAGTSFTMDFDPIKGAEELGYVEAKLHEHDGEWRISHTTRLMTVERLR